MKPKQSFEKVYGQMFPYFASLVETPDANLDLYMIQEKHKAIDHYRAHWVAYVSGMARFQQ